MISFFLIGNFTDKKKMSETFGCFLFINLRKLILNRVCNKKKKHQLHTAVSVTGILNKNSMYISKTHSLF